MSAISKRNQFNHNGSLFLAFILFFCTIYLINCKPVKKSSVKTLNGPEMDTNGVKQEPLTTSANEDQLVTSIPVNVKARKSSKKKKAPAIVTTTVAPTIKAPKSKKDKKADTDVAVKVRFQCN